MSTITFGSSCTVTGNAGAIVTFTVDLAGSTLTSAPTATCTSSDGGTDGSVTVTEASGTYTATATGLTSGKTYTFGVSVVSSTSTSTASSTAFVVG